MSHNLRLQPAARVARRPLTVAGAVALLTTTLLTAPAAPCAAQDIDLSNIDNGTGGFVINGQAAFDRSGYSVSSAGDVNGDGLADLIVGALHSDPAAGDNAGRSYVVFGKATTSDVNLVDIDNNNGGFVINGQAADDLSGWSVSSAGDVNGDALADLVVGAPYSDPAAGLDAGRCYLIFGKTDGADVNLSTVDNGTGGFVINAQAGGDRLGRSVSSAGDVNGDGLADVIVGALESDPTAGSNAGRAYVVFGKTGTADVDLSAVDNGIGGIVINGQASGDSSGRSVCSAGDVNGDGLADVIVGARNSDPVAGTDAGRSYVVFGKTDGADVDLSAVDNGVGGFAINGEAAGDYSGVSVSSAGDVNGDGLADLLVGAWGSDTIEGLEAGRSYVVFGKPDGADVDLSTIVAGLGGFAINGQAATDQSGISVSSAGDVNGDGLADVLVGAHLGAPTAGQDAGRSYLILGKSDGAIVNLSSVDNGGGGFVINGQVPDDRSGISVSTAGDVNGDGLADVIVGAWSSDTAVGDSAGSSYVVFSPLTPAASGTYRGVVAAGDADRTGIGTSRFGDDEVIFPDSRTWVDFDGGSGPGLAGSSLVTATLTRTDLGLSNTPVTLDSVANVAWEITTNRTGFTNARLTFQYTNAELAAPLSNAIDEPSLRVYRAASPAGPWTMLTGQSVDLARNQITADTPGLSHFLLAGSSVLAVDLVSFGAAAESASSPVTITWSTAAEFDTAGFHVESAPNATGPWSRVTSTLVPAEGSASSGATYSILDEAPIGAGERWYRLSETVLDGATITYDPAKASVGEAASSVGAWTLY